MLPFVRRSTLEAALAVTVLISTGGCRGAEQEPASRETPADPSAAVAAAASTGAARIQPCSVVVWTDLVAARNQPAIQAARQQILGALKAGTLELARASGVDIEQLSREALLCELPGNPRPRRAMTFRGTYPPDLLERIARLAPERSQLVPQRDGVLRVGPGWLRSSEDTPVWADDVETLDRAFGGELRDPDLRTDGLFSMRMTHERASESLAGFVSTGPLAHAQWTSIVVSTGVTGKTSEVRFMTGSTDAANHLLVGLRAFLDQAGQDPKAAKILAPAAFTAEAEATSVALRANASLEELLKLFARLTPKDAPRNPPT